MTGHKHKERSKWFLLYKFWYNINYHSALKMTPFKVMYGYEPPQLSFEFISQTKVAGIDQVLGERQLMAKALKENLKKEQNRMKMNADKRRTKGEFNEGDWVFLK